MAGATGATGPQGETGATGPIPCFCRGTLIRTPEGERFVEELRAGDVVETATGRRAVVGWVGHRRLRTDLHPAPHTVLPVRIAAGAFAPGLPVRDLMVSPGHGVLVQSASGDVLVPAGELINGRTVTRLDTREVEYFHIELDRHDIVVSEGLPTESYLDCGDRANFANGGLPMTLHPTFAAMIHEGGCAPFALVGPAVDAIRATLITRADALAAEPARPARLAALRFLGRAG
ncbi:MAG: Hint domain-containing protein [Methylobacterium sp.]